MPLDQLDAARLQRVNRIENPYRPGFNEVPLELAGRSDVLAELEDAIEIAALDGRTPRPNLIVGVRGVGKTVMLAEAATIAGTRFGWPRVHVEMRPDTPFTPDLVESLWEARELLQQPPGKRALQADSLTVRAGVPGIGGELRFARRTIDQEMDLRPALVDLVDAALRSRTGVVITLDETHLASRAELASFAALLQQATGERWPIVVVAAGLPLMRSPQHSVTYLERGVWHELDLLHLDDSIRALQAPAEAAGRPMDEDAARLLADASGGYPYAIQLYGHHAWRTSSERDRIDIDAARAALPRAQRELERGLYASRWAAATPLQRRYLIAAATVHAAGEPATAKAVASQLSRTPKQLSSVRDDLLKQGTLTVVDGTMRFTIPGMSAYALKQAI